MKSNAHIVTKNMFFQEANYYEPENYNELFNNPQAKKENDEIKRLLSIHVDPDLSVIDIGCGSGLGRELLQNENYIGIDTSKNAIDFCKKTFNNGTFICSNAEEYIKTTQHVNIVSFFAIDYMSLESIEMMIKQSDKLFFAVHCNKPYLSYSSVYAHKKDIYYQFHPQEEIDKRLKLLESYNATTFSLLDEDYYYVSIIKK